jgi:hypothetical protein
MIVTLRVEVEVEDHDVLTATIQELYDGGHAGGAALESTAEAVGEILHADIPFRDAGLSLVHWEEIPEADDAAVSPPR